MQRISSLNLDQVPNLVPMLKAGEAVMGFLPEDALIMAHCPEMLKASADFITTVLTGGTVDGGLKRMMGFVFSQANGCQYCSAHTSFTALKNGISEDKMKEIWNYKNSSSFSAKEKSALTFAIKSGNHPNQTKDTDFDDLKIYFSEKEIVELTFTLSLYAFLNNFNDTIKTKVEQLPLDNFNKIKDNE